MPKYTGRSIKTIRGSVDSRLGGPVTEKLVFNYESPDRTRGWVIDGAYVWVADPTVNVAGSANAMLLANLATDSYTKDEVTIINPDDNRSFAWHAKQYHSQNGAVDFIYPNATDTSMSAFLIDLERIITNDLYINVAFLNAASFSQSSIKIGYMIVLREVSLSPSQSVLQQLKGIGQDIDN